MYLKKSLEHISIEQFNREIDVSIEQIGNGKTYTHQQVGERIAQWKKPSI